MDVFGDGEDKESLQRKILDLGLKDRIHLLPPIHDIYSEYLNSQFLALSSDFEGFGLVIVEAMACGLPVVSFDCENGPRSIISHGVDGFLVPSFNIRFFADRILLLIHDEGKRKQMGEKGRLKSQQYAIERIALQWKELFDDLMSDHEA